MVLFLGFCEFTADGFSFRGDHAQPGAALIGHRWSVGEVVEQAGAVVLARVQAGPVPPVPARHEGSVDERGQG